MFTTYVLVNPKGQKYTGQTRDIEQRMELHNDVSPEKAKFHKTTYKRGPWKLYFRKDFGTRVEATWFERFLKTGKGREWLERARLGG